MKRTIFFLVIIPVLFSNIYAKDIEFRTEYFSISIDETGRITKLLDVMNNEDYLYDENPSYLLSVRCNMEFENPSSVVQKNNKITLKYVKNRLSARIKVTENTGYLTFELEEIYGPGEVDLVIWGPYATRIKETVGECVGVVRNNRFAIGIQALNSKTLGGYPSEENDIEPAFDIFGTGNPADITSEWKSRKLYRGQTAKIQEYGSVLQAYCRNRNKERVIANWGHKDYVAPAFDDGGINGSKIALFGCRASDALSVIGNIETVEGLPHPMINGEWAKTSKDATSSYLIIDFSVSNIDRALELTKQAGLKYLYHGGPFKTWGHFELNKESFPGNWESLKKCSEKAKEYGIDLGIHTLSNFITTNDPYVTPVPDRRLAKVGESILTADIQAESEEVFIESPRFFNQMENNTLHSVIIGNEIIRYREVSTEMPWKLLDCVRGAFGTKAVQHSKGEKVGKLMDHPYKVFLTEVSLSCEIAATIARLFNETGIMQTSFDGLEGNWSTGMGQYGRILFTKTWNDNLKPELKGRIINDASNPAHFNWHINTRYNWGEPWYAGFRESQTYYRLMNQDFYRRNLLPSMLGWFNMTERTSIEDTEWLLARAAGFDAGFAFNLNFAVTEKNGNSDEIFTAIKTWESARMAGAFSAEQKNRMQDIGNEFHLEPAGQNAWKLYPFYIRRFKFENKARQPGEPSQSAFEFENPYADQPLMFLITFTDESNKPGSAPEKITLEINNYTTIEVPISLTNVASIKLGKEGTIEFYDQSWNLIGSLSKTIKIPVIFHGRNRIAIDTEFKNEGRSALNLELKSVGDAEPVGSGSGS